LNQFEKLLELRIQQQVLPKNEPGGMYNLKDLLQEPEPGSDPMNGSITLKSRDASFPNLCSLNGNSFNGGSEEKTENHLGRHCGSPDAIECRTSSTGEIRAQLMIGTGTRERTHLRGAFVEALDCVKREVLEEVRRTRALRIPETEKTNACHTLMSAHMEVHSRLQSLNKSSSSNSPLVRCSPDKSTLEQSGCFGESALNASDASFATIAACEVFRRANKGYAALFEAVLAPSSRQRLWREHASSCSSSTTCDSLKTCTHTKFQELIRSESQKRFPATSGSCQLQ
jgi:hypothetical protein